MPACATPQRPFRVLHLSDLQTGSPSCWWAPRLSASTPPECTGEFHLDLLNGLRDDGSKRVPEIDVIVVSGDIAERALPSEYGAALRFLSSLRDALLQETLHRPALVIVPGNHDVDRKAAGRCASASAEVFAATFKPYNDFVTWFDPALLTSYERPFVMKQINFGETAVRFVGLNSCVEEGDDETRHFGWVGGRQLAEVERESAQAVDNPYTLRIAVFHHNPVFLTMSASKAIQDSIREVQAVAASEALKNSVQRAGNYLRDAREVFDTLSGLGFHVALHGHQHVRDLHTYRAPSTPGHPFHRSSVLILGAGSIGLRVGDPDRTQQPSSTSAELHEFEWKPWGWSLASRRLDILTQGIAQPLVRATTGPRTPVTLARGEDLEPLLGLPAAFDLVDVQSRSDLPKEESWDYAKKSQKPERFVIWQATKGKNARIGVDSGVDPEPQTKLDPQLKADLRTLMLFGLRDWLEGTKVYGDDVLLALTSIAEQPDGPKLSLVPRKFSRTHIFNWLLSRPILTGGKTPVSFKAKHLVQDIPSSSGIPGWKKFISQHPYLSWRLEVSVIATIDDATGPVFVFKRRSRDVAVSGGKLTLFTTGAMRPTTPIRELEWLAPPSDSLIRDAAIIEMERETGFSLSGPQDNRLRLIGMYVDPVYFTPVVLYWLHVSRAECVSYMKAPPPGGRDRWEGDKLYEVQSGSDSWESLINRIKLETGGLELSKDPQMALYMWKNSGVVEDVLKS